MFQILPFDLLLSNVHNGVSVEFISKPVKPNNEEQNAQKVKWIKENKDSFVNAIELNSVLLLEEKISEVSSLGTVNEPPHGKTNKMACAPSEDSGQPQHPASLIRVFAVRMKKVWILNYR